MGGWRDNIYSACHTSMRPEAGPQHLHKKPVSSVCNPRRKAEFGGPLGLAGLPAFLIGKAQVTVRDPVRHTRCGQGWEDGSMVRSISCSCRGLPHQAGSSRTPVAPSSGDLTLSQHLWRGMWFIYINEGKTILHIK